MTTTVQLRIDAATKMQAQKILEKLGLDLSSGIKMFLSQVVRTKSIPFVARTENGYTPAREREIIRGAEWTKKHGKRYPSAKAMLDDILG
jgi:addiction module RelB/DinJ family antitoxin